MALYNNKKQEKLFHLHDPKKSTSVDCDPIKDAFSDFACEKSYILAQPTGEFNCIGWAIGVKLFIDPTQQINKYYTEKISIGDLMVKYHSGVTSSVTLYEYKKSSSACMESTKLFFENHKDHSVLLKKANYVAVNKIPHPPLDDTIAFYFKEGKDEFEGKEIVSKGFQHAARYIEDVNSWVSDVWTSKLGQYKLMTHNEHELDGTIYGHILCYLTSNDSGISHDEL